MQEAILVSLRKALESMQKSKINHKQLQLAKEHIRIAIKTYKRERVQITKILEKVLELIDKKDSSLEALKASEEGYDFIPRNMKTQIEQIVRDVNWVELTTNKD